MSENVFQMPRSEVSAESSELASEPLPAAEKQPRGRSTIEFPYADLSDALAIAKAIESKGASPLSRDQLAAVMGQPPNSGSFVSKVQAAKQFGIVELLPDGRVKLTELGFEAIGGDDARARLAWASAFLNVPLFKRAYTEFRNRPLPPRPHGLEQAFIGFGVLEKRKTNARWAFDRSAKQAGFFDAGDDRLVMPVIIEDAQGGTWRPMEALPVSPNAETIADPISAAAEPLIRGLLDRLPPPGGEWPLKDRIRWLRALAVNFGMVYHGVEDGDVAINPPAISEEVPQPRVQPPVTVVTEPPPPPPPAPPKKTAPSAPSWDSPKGGGDLDDEIPF